MSQLAALGEVLLWVAAVLLLLAGTAKLRHPGGTVTALRDAGLPARGGSVRFLGVVEVAAGVAVLSIGGPVPAALVALLYGAFAAFVVRQRRSSAGGSCGCFGEERTPVAGLHVVVNAVATLGAVVAATTPPRPPLDALAGAGPDVLLGTLVLVVVGAWLVRLGLTAGAELQATVALHPRSDPS